MPTKRRGVFLLLAIFLYSHICLAIKVHNHLGFGFDNEKIEVIIPFSSYNNLIIIQATIDEKNKLNLILDTGIRSLVLFDKSYLPKLSKNTFIVNFTGAGTQRPLDAEVSTNHNLRLCDDVVANQINAVILNHSNKYLHKIKGIKIHGAFGYQLFARFQIRIDYKNQLITLNEPFKTENIPGFEAIPISIHDTKPFVETGYVARKNKWNRMNLMLDLGANHQVLLHDSFNINSSANYSGEKIRIAEGLSGSITGIKDHCKALILGSVIYHDIEMLIPSESTYSHEQITGIKKHGSIGGKFFKASVIIIDYINGYLFINCKEKDYHNKDYLANTIHE